MSKGFTLIELIISIFVISIAVIGIYGAFSVVVILTSDSADRLVGAYLAQEGMELVRNIRDSNWLKMDAGAGDNWLEGMTSETGSNCQIGCEIDYKGDLLMPWAGKYLVRNTHNLYSYSEDGIETKFKRKIKIIPIQYNSADLDYVVKVITEVSWDQKATVLNSSPSIAGNCGEINEETGMVRTNCIRAEETLYDWYGYLPFKFKVNEQ